MPQQGGRSEKGALLLRLAIRSGADPTMVWQAERVMGKWAWGLALHRPSKGTISSQFRARLALLGMLVSHTPGVP